MVLASEPYFVWGKKEKRYLQLGFPLLLTLLGFLWTKIFSQVNRLV